MRTITAGAVARAIPSCLKRVGATALFALLAGAAGAPSASMDRQAAARAAAATGLCRSVVVVRCAPSERSTAAPAGTAGRSTAQSTQGRLDQARSTPIDDSSALEPIVVIGKRIEPKTEQLRSSLREAARTTGPVGFNNVERSDGSRCTCFEPCVLNCCVCARSGATRAAEPQAATH